jgi:hypothetical protein
VARKSKIDQEKKANADPPGPDPAARAAEGIVARKPKAKATSSSPKTKKSSPKKKTAAPAKPAEKAASVARIAGPSDEEIRIRAYFIAERRLQLSLPGDSAHDWIEAKRQLMEEAGPASS